MIRFRCDKCEKLLEVPDEQGGMKVACPACADVNTVPLPVRTVIGPGAADTSPVPPDRAADAGYPSDRGPEASVMFVRPAMFRARPLLFGGLLLVALAGVASFIAGLVGTATTPALIIIGAGAVVLTAGYFCFWLVQTKYEGLEITTKRTIWRRGLFSRSISEVVHDDIRNIQIEQSFWSRIWGVGVIGISSAGQDDVEIHMADVPNPDRVRKVIDLYRPL